MTVYGFAPTGHLRHFLYFYTKTSLSLLSCVLLPLDIVLRTALGLLPLDTYNTYYRLLVRFYGDLAFFDRTVSFLLPRLTYLVLCVQTT